MRVSGRFLVVQTEARPAPADPRDPSAMSKCLLRTLPADIASRSRQMEANENAQQSAAWLVAETLVISSAVVATIAGLGMALHLAVGAVRLALAFVA
jgi:hypothetical protein